MMREIFGTYELLFEIQALGPSRRWLARALQGGALVLVHQVPTHVARHKPYLRGYHTATRRTRRLSQGNIARVYDGNVDRVCYYAVAEFVRGEPLSELMRRMEAPLPVEATLSVIESLAYATAALHTAVGSKGQPAPLVHGELDPDHVLITYSGEVKLVGAEVGAARQDRARRGHRTSARLHEPRGTGGRQAHTSLQRLRPRRHLVGAAHLAAPLRRGGRLRVDAGYLRARTGAPSSIVPNIPPLVDALTSKMLDKNPKQRPGAARIALALTKYIERFGSRHPLQQHLWTLFPDRVPHWKQLFEAEANGDRELLLTHAHALLPAAQTEASPEDSRPGIRRHDAARRTMLSASGRAGLQDDDYKSPQELLRGTLLSREGRAAAQDAAVIPPLDMEATSLSEESTYAVDSLFDALEAPAENADDVPSVQIDATSRRTPPPSQVETNPSPPRAIEDQETAVYSRRRLLEGARQRAGQQDQQEPQGQQHEAPKALLNERGPTKEYGVSDQLRLERERMFEDETLEQRPVDARDLEPAVIVRGSPPRRTDRHRASRAARSRRGRGLRRACPGHRLDRRRSGRRG